MRLPKEFGLSLGIPKVLSLAKLPSQGPPLAGSKSKGFLKFTGNSEWTMIVGL